MELKEYQADTLSVLQRFLELARAVGPSKAYEEITVEPELAERLGGHAGPYEELRGLPEVPYVCLRLPTGGGKTILAAHGVAVARSAWIERDHPLVLWLVPTNTIRRQTVEALKDSRHAYREVLNRDFDGRVRVFDIADFTHLRPQDVRSQCCIVVGTIQTLRVKSTEGRKVYAHNEEMEAHFASVQDTPPGMERLQTGAIKFSFANLLHRHRPLMVVDEAHNAVTGLTRDMQKRVNPCAIVEFTATPRPKSNILYSVRAQELKQEEMIKLPIMLSEHDSWQNAVNGAIAARASLAKTASEDEEYVRPIVLFQAQPKNQEVTVEALKEYLVEGEQIPEEKIAIATGNQRELDGIDLFDRTCPVEYVITVEALKEGWDCSFAYVFCSVSRIRSATDVEQLLGRVLRMPYARRRQSADLNRAYAFLSEPSFGEAARALVDKLIGMGFEEEEARDQIEAVAGQREDQADLFGPKVKPNPQFKYRTAVTPEILSKLKEAKVPLRDVSGEGEVEIAIDGWVHQDCEHVIYEALPEGERHAFSTALAKHRVSIKDQVPAAAQGQAFEVPRLMSSVQGALEFADTDVFMEDHDWSLLNHSARMDEQEFNVREIARRYEIDIDGRKVTYHSAGEQEEFALDIAVEGWTPEALVLWLDRQVRQPDIHQIELLKWLGQLVDHLLKARGVSIAALMRCKFLLARTVEKKILGIRQKERDSVYQRRLLASEAQVTVSFDSPFTFKEGIYLDQRCYRGSWKPAKHFLGPDRVPAFDGADDGEEVRCAQTIDGLPEVRYWIRNVARHSASFWLPTASGRFYPDFVALLKDDRLLVVEYKGAHIAEGTDTVEKRTIGALWERVSRGQGLFVIAERNIHGKDVRQQLLERIATQGRGGSGDPLE